MASNRHLHVAPNIDPTAWIAESTDLIGAVTIGKQASIWFQVVIHALRFLG